MHDSLGEEETKGENAYLFAATDMAAIKYQETYLQREKDEIGIGKISQDGATNEEIKEWAENLGYLYDGITN
jgi:hypothetical protein